MDDRFIGSERADKEEMGQAILSSTLRGCLCGGRGSSCLLRTLPKINSWVNRAETSGIVRGKPLGVEHFHVAAVVESALLLAAGLSTPDCPFH
jgi:hypothetical protein